MPENPTLPAADTPSTVPSRNDAVLNQAQVQALAKAEQIVAAARKEAYAPALAAREITAALLATLVADIARARDTSARAIQSTTGKEVATSNHGAAKTRLLVPLQEIQAAAKQKYARREPAKLQDYFVGKRLDQSRDGLLQYAAGILLKLQGDPDATPPAPADPLPGITPLKIAALVTARQVYRDARSTQEGEQSDATDERTERDDLIDSITDRRVEIQFAADGEWPYSDEANAGVRREFYLPLSQPYNG
jgi:hypothetical protein